MPAESDAQRPVELFPLRLDARGVHRSLEDYADGIGERRARNDELVRVCRQIQVRRAAHAGERTQGDDKAVLHSLNDGRWCRGDRFADWLRR